MQQPRGELLARARLAEHQHRGIRGRHPGDVRTHLGDGRAPADQPLARNAGHDAAQVIHLALQGRALERVHQLVVLEGLGEEAIGAPAHGLHRGLDGAVRGEDDHRQLRNALAGLGEHLQAIHVSQPEIEHHRVHLATVHQLERLLAGGDARHLHALGLQAQGDELTQLEVVIHHQHAVGGGGRRLAGRAHTGLRAEGDGEAVAPAA